MTLNVNGKKQQQKSNAYTSLYGLDYLSIAYNCYLVGTSWLCMLMLRVQLQQKSFLIYEDSVLDISAVSISNVKCQSELGNVMKHEVMNCHHFCQAS